MSKERESLSALLADVPEADKTAVPDVDRDKIREISEESGFPSRQAKPKKKATPKPKLVEPGAGRAATDLSDDEVEERINARRSGRRSEGPKVQFNVRIPNRAFVKIDDMREQTGEPFGKLIERAIDLLERDMS